MKKFKSTFYTVGINIAVHGYTEERGKFFVEDYCYASLSDPVSLPLVSENK